jgi:FkbM family methyltransferase
MKNLKTVLVNIHKLAETLYYQNKPAKIINLQPFISDLLGRQSEPYTLNIRWKNRKVSFALRPDSPDKWPIEEIILKDVYRIQSLRLNRQPIAIDLGAHIGIFSLWFNTVYPDSSVYCFEPHPDNFQLLKKNVNQNRRLKHIHPFPYACGGKTGTKLFSTQPTTLSIVQPGQKGPKSRLPTLSLASIFKQNELEWCDLLKMDIEGAEYEVFYNTPISILRKIDHLVMEYHDLNRLTSLNGRSLKAFLEKAGFTVKLSPSRFDRTGYLYAGRNNH